MLLSSLPSRPETIQPQHNPPLQVAMADDLPERIQALPPELFNQIEAEVLTYQDSNIRHVYVTAKYEFPKQLHISTAWREQYALRYFANTIFVFASPKVFRSFTSTMDDGHLLGVKNMCIKFKSKIGDPGYGWRGPGRWTAWTAMRTMMDRMSCIRSLGHTGSRARGFWAKTQWEKDLRGESLESFTRAMALIDEDGETIDEDDAEAGFVIFRNDGSTLKQYAEGRC